MPVMTSLWVYYSVRHSHSHAVCISYPVSPNTHTTLGKHLAKLHGCSEILRKTVVAQIKDPSTQHHRNGVPNKTTRKGQAQGFFSRSPAQVLQWLEASWSRVAFQFLRVNFFPVTSWIYVNFWYLYCLPLYSVNAYFVKNLISHANKHILFYRVLNGQFSCHTWEKSIHRTSLGSKELGLCSEKEGKKHLSSPLVVGQRYK